MPDLNAYLNPSSIAVFGASNDQTILRGRLMSVLMGQPYPGRIYPVSQSANDVMGLKAYRRVTDMPEVPDLAILIIPAAYCIDALEECGSAGVKAAHIITSGFAEEPGEVGAARQTAIRRVAEKYDMAICGPNSQGFMNAGLNLTATFSPAARSFTGSLLPEFRTDGFVSVVAQSGGLGFSFFDHGRPKGLPFNYVVTTGNEAALEHLDIVDHLIDRDETDVFLIFMEDVKSPEKLRAVGEKALRAGKPVIVSKVGSSDAGQRAAISHTAALAGAHSGYQAMFRKYGMIECAEQDEVVDIASGFSHWGQRLPAGFRAGIVTSSGGAGGMMADAVSAAGLQVPELDAASRAEIDRHLPSYGSSQNPVDATAQAVRELGHYRLNAMVAASPEVDALVCITSATDAPATLRSKDDLIRLKQEMDKPALFYSYTTPAPESVQTFAEAGVPLIWNARHCARTLFEMAQYRQVRERFLRPVEIATDPGFAEARRLLSDAPRVLTEHRAGNVLKAAGLPWCGGNLVSSAQEASRTASGFGRAVAMKVQSPDILHKSDAGAVAVGVETADASETFDRLMQNAGQHAPGASIEGVLVQPMAKPGVEVILGIQRDPHFGPMLMVGLGGVLVEVLKDVAFAPLPLSVDEAHALLDRLKGRAVLDGVRGAPPSDVPALIDVMVRLSGFVENCGDMIEEIDLNPVFVHPAGDGVHAADALIVKRGPDT